MMKQRIYIDNSVIGGYFDEEFEDVNKQLFDRIKAKDFDIYFSKVNEAELSLPPKHIRDIKKLIPTDCYKHIDLNDDAKNLQKLMRPKKFWDKRV